MAAKPATVKAIIDGINMCCSMRMLDGYYEWVRKQSIFFDEVLGDKIKRAYNNKLYELKGSNHGNG